MFHAVLWFMSWHEGVQTCLFKDCGPVTVYAKHNLLSTLITCYNKWSIHVYIYSHTSKTDRQIIIFPKPELKDFGWIPLLNLLNHHLGWPTGGLVAIICTERTRVWYHHCKCRMLGFTFQCYKKEPGINYWAPFLDTLISYVCYIYIYYIYLEIYIYIQYKMYTYYTIYIYEYLYIDDNINVYCAASCCCPSIHPQCYILCATTRPHYSHLQVQPGSRENAGPWHEG